MIEPPFFFIYGQPVEAVNARFVHVERVRDRVNLHHGKVEAHRHPHLHQISLWERASGRYLIEDETLSLPARALTLIPAGTAHGFEIDDGSDAVVISLAVGYSTTVLGNEPEAIWSPLKKPALLPLQADLAQRLDHLFGAIVEEYQFASAYSEEAIACHLRLLLIFANRLIHLRGDGAIVAQPDALLSSFLRLVDQNLRLRWPVGKYVEALSTTTYLLNAATRQAFGQTASELLRDRLIAEAKRLMLFSKLTVAEVGYALNFYDPSHFGRFFHQQCGEAPAAWRQAQISQRLDGRRVI